MITSKEYPKSDSIWHKKLQEYESKRDGVFYDMSQHCDEWTESCEGST